MSQKIDPFSIIWANYFAGATTSATNHIGHNKKISATAKKRIGQTENPYQPQNISDECLIVSCSPRKGLDTCYSASYMSQTRDQQRFTISEVAADWQLAWANGAAAHYVAIHCPR